MTSQPQSKQPTCWRITDFLWGSTPLVKWSRFMTPHIRPSLLVSWGGVRLSPIGMSATNWSIVYQSRMTYDESGAVSGMRIGRRNQSPRRKPAPMPLFPPKIPHYLTWARTLAAVVGNRWLITWTMARPRPSSTFLPSPTLRALTMDCSKDHLLEGGSSDLWAEHFSQLRKKDLLASVLACETPQSRNTSPLKEPYRQSSAANNTST
jgi:hypothetical protein